MFRRLRRIALLWPARLLALVLACALLTATVPRIVVHAHADAGAGHHHDAAGADDDTQSPSSDGAPHVHDAGGISTMTAGPVAPDAASPSSALAVAARGATNLPATLPDFRHRPPIA